MPGLVRLLKNADIAHALWLRGEVLRGCLPSEALGETVHCEVPDCLVWAVCEFADAVSSSCGLAPGSFGSLHIVREFIL